MNNSTSNPDPMQDYYDSMEGKTIFELAAEMNDIRLLLDTAKEVKTSLQKKYDALRLNLVPSAMDDEGVTSINIDGIGRMGLTADLYASIPADQKPEAYEWLRDNQHGDIIKETVNAGTLKATFKAIIKKGEETIPENIFKVTPFSRAAITKK